MIFQYNINGKSEMIYLNEAEILKIHKKELEGPRLNRITIKFKGEKKEEVLFLGDSETKRFFAYFE